MKVKLWGTRGSIPSPGPETVRYGGNTSCVGVTLSDGSLLALDAGTGIRSLGLGLAAEPARLHILLTHLHLDHIQGLVFFAPAFHAQTEIVIWGPASPEASLRDRIARYISAPLSPVEVRELPCDVSFRHCPQTEWEIGSARISAASVAHRGPTLGYRIDDGATPRSRTRFPSPAAPKRSARCSSITTRCTPTSSSTGSAAKRASAGSPWAATRARSSWRWSAASTSCRLARRAPRLQVSHLS
jgi:ribonuclease BN (tRNA processing enzyme)